MHSAAARKLKQKAGNRIAHPAFDGLDGVDAPLKESKPFKLGSVVLESIFTPGHPDGHHACRVGERVLTGDAPTLYHSVREKLFALPEDTLVYPAHDYKGRRVSSVAQEKARNPRLGGDKPLAEFVQIMKDLNLDYPKFIDHAVPGNRECGKCPDGVPDDLQQYCAQIGESVQG